MLGADARLLTEGEDIVSHDLFAKWNSKQTLTGEDEDEDTELKFLAEIRAVRDQQPDVFERIKRLRKKARSTRTLSASSIRDAILGRTDGVDDGPMVSFPALVTYFRQGKLDKFFIAASSRQRAIELDFMSAAKMLKPGDPKEIRQPIPREFYDLLDRNKSEFVHATTGGVEKAETTHRGSPNDTYILKRLKDKAVRRCQKFIEDDEDFVAKVIRLVEDGSLPKATAKRVAAALKKPENLQPLKVLAVMRRDIIVKYLQTNPVARDMFP